MDRPNTLFFPVETFEEADWETASRHIMPAPGIVYVELYPYAQKKGSLYLPDQTAQRYRCDAGTVIASGKKRAAFHWGGKLRFDPHDIALPPPGEPVVCISQRGDGYEEFEAGRYKVQGRVRVYGNGSTHRQRWLPHWAETVIASIQGGKLRSLYDKVLLRRDPLRKQESGLYLPDSQSYRAGLATVVDPSPVGKRGGLEPGMRVHYKQDAVIIDTEFAEEYLKRTDPGFTDEKDYCFIRFEDILAVINA